MKNLEQRVMKLRQSNMDADPQVGSISTGLTMNLFSQVLATASKLSEAIGYTLGISITTPKTRESNTGGEQKVRSKSSKSLAKQQRSKDIVSINNS